jgi:hypothetical protein
MTRSDKQVDLSPTIQNFFGCNFRLIYIENTKFVGLMKTSNFMFDELTVVKSKLVNLCLFLVIIKKQFHQILQFVNPCKHIFGLGIQCDCLHIFPRKEGGIQVLACLAPSNLTVASLFRISWAAKPARTIQH